MYDPVSVDTVLINDVGDLLVGLSDGNVINAGRARGLQGPQGERGLMGMRGEPGRDEDDVESLDPESHTDGETHD